MSSDSPLCSKCGQPAVIFLRYSGLHLCKQHFNEFFVRRVKKEVKKQGRLRKGDRLGIAVSGGKDSVVLLHLIHALVSERSDVELVVLTVDEGIKGYRNPSIDIVRKHAEDLKVDLDVLSFEESVGFSVDEIAQMDVELGECSYCGVFRRFCLNLLAKKNGVNKLVLGHNLDDMAQSVLMNIVNGDVRKLMRLGPHLKVRPGLIPRRLPLRLIPEKEVMLYALLNGIEFFDGECPYAVHASRGYYRDVVDRLEYENPGSRHGIVRSFDSIREILAAEDSDQVGGLIGSCHVCGEPTSAELCKCCELRKNLLKQMK